jgi:hypothetical protein
MALHVPAPSSGDGLYELADAPPPADAVTPPPLPAEAANGRPGAEEAKVPQQEANAETRAPVPPAPKARKRRRRRSLRHEAPAWAVSLMVHVVVLTALGLGTFSSEVQQAVVNINSALVATSKERAEELTPIYADPAKERSDQAVGSEAAPASGGSEGGGGSSFLGIGSGPPSATPRVAGVGTGVGEKTSLPGIKVVANMSGLGMLPTASRLGVDLGGGGMVGGDITYEASDVGVALDQLAREILRHLTQHKLTVVWLFDESESMKDDQKAIKLKFDRVASELKANVESNKKQANVLSHAIVGFGKDLHYELEKPTTSIAQIEQAIDRLQVDDSGIENTMEALHAVVDHYSGLIKKDRKLLIVLVTDESGDDGNFVEEAHQALVSRGVPLYVIGRQSLFGYSQARLRYVDPVTKDVYWPTIRRGPESADFECLQWDGLHDRWDEQPSGFGPYELARLAKDTGGIYFLLPSEEEMRIRQREKAYSLTTLKEYVPDNEGRAAYVEKRNRSELRRTMYEIIMHTRPVSGENRGFAFQRHFPILPDQMIPQAQKAGAEAQQRLTELVAIQKKLMSLRKLRDLEPDKRWQAHYDLMLAQIVTYQVKAYEYMACMKDMIQTRPRPKQMPTPDLVVEWVIEHSKERKAPKEETEKKYVEAEKLLKEVIERHPKTPWADLAQDELNRGFGTQRHEWHHNPKYDERRKLMPKY